MNKLFLTAGAVVLVLAARAGVATDDHRRRPPQIEGAWVMEVTLRTCGPDGAPTDVVAPVPNPIFPAINTFHQGGTMSEHGARISPATRNSGQGIWKRTGRNTFKSRFLFQRFDVNGFYIGTQDSTRNMTLSDDGNSLSISATTVIADANGVVLVRGCATEVGERLEL